MSWTTRDIPDLGGRVAVVTGANSGLGLETTRALAAHGATVVMATRDQRRANEARAAVLAELPDASLELVPLDLGDLASVAEAAEAIGAAHERIDLLINNAGLMAQPERRTADGFEMQFGVNHLGHWALTAQLLPALLRADAARVVTVTSTAHHVGRRIDPRNPHLEGNYGPWKAYGRAKLANLHFALGLQRRFEDAGLPARSLAAHPGLAQTDLQSRSVREQGGPLTYVFERLQQRTGMSATEGALSQLRAATDPAAPGGGFYGPLWVNSGPPVPKPVLRVIGLERSIRVLWVVSERETGIALNVAAAARQHRS
jgi:NAD(P)-dependent dehydrogenase (short-subunit alcohol dehydrogenase family)